MYSRSRNRETSGERCTGLRLDACRGVRNLTTSATAIPFLAERLITPHVD